jgi:formamidopyrimidine-DNA glycosylase
MPELPEVETMRRGALGITGGVIRAFVVLPCPRKPIAIQPAAAILRKRVEGRTVVDVGRIGKRVVVRLDSSDSLVFEPRMTGLVLLNDPPTAEHLRVRLDLDGCAAPSLWYWDRRGLGLVYLLSERELAERLGGEKLGPDALAITCEELRSRLGGSRREIKPALLDQRAVAGIGNLYASEILHRARISPRRKCDRLTKEQWLRLWECTGEILEEAIRYEGSTLSDGTYRNALNQAGGYQNHHRVYDREGSACATCHTGIIRRIVQTQRATFYCPKCQKG